MSINDLIFNIFNGLISVYINCFFFETFLPKKEFKLRRLSLLILTIVFILFLIIKTDKVLNFIALFLIVLILSFLYCAKWYTRIFLSFAVILLSSLAEIIVALISSYVTKAEMSTLKTGVLFAVGVLLSKLLSFAIMAVIRFGRHSLPFRKIGSLWLYIGALIITSVIMLFVVSDYMYAIHSRPIMQTLTLFGVCLLVAVNVLIFYVIDKVGDYYYVQHNLTVANKLIERQRNTYKELFDGQTEIKAVKHDLKNVMLGILHQIENNETEKAKEYIKSTCNILESSSVNTLSGNSIIDTVLLAKKQIADANGIKMNIDLKLFEKINIDAVDFSVLLGNIVDNAIEAAEKLTKFDKLIYVSIFTRNSNIVIVAKNPVEQTVNTDYLLTTKAEKSEHGFGLIQIKKLSAKYNGEVLLNCFENEFEIAVYLNNNTIE